MWSTTRMLETDNAIVFRDERRQFIVAGFMKRNQRMPEAIQQRRATLRANQSAGFSYQGKIAAEVIAVRQVVGKFPQGQNRRAAQVNRNGDFSPRTHPGGDADSLGRPRTRARVAGDDEENPGGHEGRISGRW